MSFDEVTDDLEGLHHAPTAISPKLHSHGTVVEDVGDLRLGIGGRCRKPHV